MHNVRRDLFPSAFSGFASSSGRGSAGAESRQQYRRTTETEDLSETSPSPCCRGRAEPAPPEADEATRHQKEEGNGQWTASEELRPTKSRKLNETHREWQENRHEAAGRVKEVRRTALAHGQRRAGEKYRTDRAVGGS